jgi:hypothetical protein
MTRYSARLRRVERSSYQRRKKAKVGKRNDEPRGAKQYFRKRKETGILVTGLNEHCQG